mgnify:CR=1 FL=1
MKNFKNELIRFFMVGVAVVATDAIIYYFLLFFWQPWLAKAAAFICGTTVAYLLNKFWTFKKPGYSHKELIKFITLYMTSIIINVGLNALILSFGSSFFIAYIITTGITASLNFIGQKVFIFSH